jgi:hypothetical protein
MRQVACLSLIALALLTPACAGDADAEASSEPLTPAELGWIHAYADLTIDIYNGDLGPTSGPLLVKKCRERFEELGEAPTDRLRPGAEVAPATCPLLAHRGMHRRALDVIDEADDLIRPILFEMTSLPLEATSGKESRADLDLSSWASRELGDPAEVRCWSDDDWPRIVRENDAWADEHTDAEDLYGWADDYTDRIHMRIDQCNVIQAFRAHGVGTGSAGETETADALGTLFHETTHLRDGDLDEAEVECEVLYWFSSYAGELGPVDWDHADRLARVYRTKVYPHQPEEYLSDCDE